MIKLDDNTSERFHALETTALATRVTLEIALEHYQREQQKLIREGQSLWGEIKERFSLEGEWRFESGRIIAMPSPDEVMAKQRAEQEPFTKPGDFARAQAGLANVPFDFIDEPHAFNKALGENNADLASQS